MVLLWSSAAALPAPAQEPDRVLISDGTRIQFPHAVYGAESGEVRDQVLRNPASVPRGGAAAPPACTDDAATSFRVDDSAYGRFTGAAGPEIAYLYTRCDRSRGHTQGVLVLRGAGDRKKGRDPFVAHYAHAYSGDVKLTALPDLDGNGRNELAIVSGEGRAGKTVRIVEFTRSGVTRFGTFDIEKVNPLRQARLYAEKRPGAAPAFFSDMRQMTAAGWRQVQPLEPATLAPDASGYFRGASRPGFRLAEAAFLTAVVQTVAFVALILATLGFIVRLFFSNSDKAKTTAAAAAKKRARGPAAPVLPALRPLNCPACGAGVPLRGDMLVCPSCANRFAAPKSYDEIRIFRDLAARRLKRATRYWRMANVLTSRWMGRALFALSLWLIASIPLLYIDWYQLAYIERIAKPGESLIVLACLSYVFWIPTLMFTAGSLSPKARKALPTIETGESAAAAENANCAQCGGAIHFDKADLAAVCGYCGVETYRARLAWRLRDLANDARARATFSLIDAMKSVRAAVEDIVTLPMIFAFIFIIGPACVMGLSVVGDWLGLGDVFEFLGIFF